MARRESAEDKLINFQAAQLASQVANWAAQLEFQKERMRLLELPQFQAQTEIERQRVQIQVDELAFKKAVQAHSEAIEEASLTGTYKGQPTLAWLEQQAKMTGVINGQQTLEGKLTDAQIAQMNHNMQLQSKQFDLEFQKFGFDKDRWAQEFGQSQTNDLRNYLLQEAGITGTFNGQDTLAKKQADRDAALNYLRLTTELQGNPFKMLRMQQQGGGTFDNLARGFLGEYEMAGSGGVTGNPGLGNVSDLLNPLGTDGQPVNPAAAGPAVAGQPVVAANGTGNLAGVQQLGVAPVGVAQTGAIGAAGLDQKPFTMAVPSNIQGGIPAQYDPATGALIPGTGVKPISETTPQLATDTAYTYSPPGVQAPVQAYNYETTPTGQTQVSPPGIAAPASQPQVSASTFQTPFSMSTSPQTGQAGATGAAGATTPVSQAKFTPNKINAENYANATAGKQKLLWQYFADQGWTEEEAQEEFRKTLPRTGGPNRGAVRRTAA